MIGGLLVLITFSDAHAACMDTGVIAHFRLDEGVGTSTGDHSGNGVQGSLNNTDDNSWVYGRLRHAIDFDGSDDFVSTDAVSSVRSVSLWFNHTGAFKDQSTLFDWRENNGYSAAIDSGGILRIYYSGDAGDKLNTVSTLTLTTNTLYHLVVAYNGSTFSMYLNGEDVGSGSKSVSPDDTSGAFYIGTGLATPTDVFDGIIDNVVIYDCELSNTEMNRLYQSRHYNLKDSLIARWKLDEGSGSSAFNTAQSGTTLTWIGSGAGSITSPGWATDVSSTISFDSPYSMQFDGTDDAMFNNTDVPTGINVTSGTFSLWVKFDAGTVNDGSTRYLISIRLNNSNHISMIKVSTNKFWMAYRQGGTFYQALSSEEITFWEGTWHHVAGTWDGTYLKLYEDGVLSGIGTRGSDISTPTAILIASRNGFAEFTQGYLDDIRIYNRVLSGEEIYRLAKTYRSSEETIIRDATLNNARLSDYEY